MAVKDIEFIDDIAIKNGDLKIAESDQQHLEHIIKVLPGQFYQWPTIGVGIDTKKLGSITAQELKQQIKQNVEADNYRVNKLDVIGDVDKFSVSIDANRLK